MPEWIVAVLGTLLVGGAGVLFMERRKKSASVKLREKVVELSTMFAQVQKNLDEEKERAAGLALANAELERENVRLASDRDNQKKYMNERFADYEKNKEELLARFQNISNDIIKLQTEQFSAQQKKSLDTILEPFKVQLSDFKAKVENVHKDSVSNKASFDEQLKQLLSANNQLSQEAKDLSSALKGNKKVVGDWGEFQLTRALELAGLEQGIDFEVQSNFKDEDDKNKRPDVIVSLPDNRKIIIDAKVSLNDYVKYANAENKIEQERFLDLHIKCLKNHIDELTGKEYQKLLKESSLDYVIMFVPIEGAFVDAVRRDTGLYDYAYKNSIMIATPSSILGFLKTVESIWRLEKQSKNVQKIAEMGGSLYDKIANFLGSMEKVGSALKGATNNYDEAMKRLKDGKGNLLVTAEKLKDYGAKVTKKITNTVEDE